ncbi:hypothetical protein KC359_g4475 [Hortaea werneckii]|nr:hypothetical protein KC359_g4475 [Hortaea werneckii]
MSTASKHSPLLALPKELRLVIYDELFTPLTQRPKHFDTYVLPSEWPRIDFTSYRALLLTCKEVKEEATTHFEGHFLRDVMVYFDNVVDLRNFYFKIKRASDPEKLAGMWVCLHTLPWGIENKLDLAKKSTGSIRFRYFNSHTNKCCVEAIIDNDLNPQVSHRLVLKGTCRVIAGISQNSPFNCTHKMRGSAKLDVVERTGQSGPFRTTFKVISRQICSDYYTEYIQMVAPIGCLGGHEGLLPCQSYEENALDGKEEGTGGCLWPGTKEYEQELKKKYVLDA